MEQQLTIDNGYAGCGGAAAEGWYAGVLVIDDVDAPFLPARDADYDTARENCLHWQQAYARVGRRVVLARQGDADTRELALAERVCGPVCPRETVDAPVLAWTQRTGGAWELKCFADGHTRTVVRSTHVLRRPQVAVGPDGLVLAYERDLDVRRGEAVVVDITGRVIFRAEGRKASLAGTPRGVVLLTEQCSRNAVTLRLDEIVGGAAVRTVEIAGGDDYTLNADLACDADGTVYVVAESCPAFGMDCRVGIHRDLKAWRWEPQGDPVDISGPDGRLPIPRRTFNYWSDENLPPIRPRIFCEAAGPVVTYRQFRHFAFKTFGWDVCWCRWDGDGWGAPTRLTEHMGTPDTGYAVAPVGDGYVSVHGCIDNAGGPSRCTNHRVEIDTFDAGHRLPPCEIPDEQLGEYIVATGYTDIAPPPPPLAEPHAGRTLIWGDLHPHTNYSKCVSAQDSSPDEMFRYMRDVLGCEVFTFMDHSRMMSGPENTWVNDRLEIEAGPHGIVLHGSEPGTRPGHDTNWYARDRETYDRLRCIMDTGDFRESRRRSYRLAVEELPVASVLALRHFHGGGLSDAECVQTFEPRLEVAMEAMQGRVNALIEARCGMVLFPNQFLDAGLKVGLIGGTDHYRGKGPNHFCLTGFWVKQRTVEGVWEALHTRHTIAMSDSRIALAATISGEPAGRDVAIKAGEEIRVRLSAACARPIRRATLIRDGEILPWIDVGATATTIDLIDPAPTPGRHWYVPTVEVDTAYGDDNAGYGHTSPFFVIVRE